MYDSVRGWLPSRCSFLSHLLVRCALSLSTPRSSCATIIITPVSEPSRPLSALALAHADTVDVDVDVDTLQRS